MLAALLALAASVSWGSSDFLGGVESRRRSVWSVNAVSQVAAVLCAALAVIIRGTPPLGFTQTLAPALGGVAAGVAVIAYYRALAIGTMSIVAPIAACGTIVPVLLGFSRGERPGWLQVGGMALAVAGVALVSRAKGRSGGRVSLRSVAYAVISGVGFGAILVGFDLGGKSDPYWAVFDARIGAAAIIGLYLAVRRPRLEVPARVLPVLVLVGVLLVVANTLFTVASTYGYLSVVAVLGSLGPAVTAGFAGGILGERLTPTQWAGAATVLCGAILLAAG